jgi:hypothetical protein
VVRARTESNLGFRVAGKILERLVDPGDRVRIGQALTPELSPAQIRDIGLRALSPARRHRAVITL